MQVTLDSSALQKIYTGILTAYYAHLENKNLVSSEEVNAILSLKTHFSSMIDINSLFFKQEETIIDSPFIHSYSKDCKDYLNIDFSILGLMWIKKCLDIRYAALEEYKKQYEYDDPNMLNEIEDAIIEVLEVSSIIESKLIPISN